MDNGEPRNPVRSPFHIIEYRDGAHPPGTVICHIDQVISTKMRHGKRVEKDKIQECIQVRVPKTEITGNREQGKIRSPDKLGEGELSVAVASRSGRTSRSYSNRS